MKSIRNTAAWILAGASLLAMGFLFVTGSPFPAKAQEPKRFQYKIVEVLPDTQTMQSILNEHGMSGWELVAVSMGSMTEPRLIFKK